MLTRCERVCELANMNLAGGMHHAHLMSAGLQGGRQVDVQDDDVVTRGTRIQALHERIEPGVLGHKMRKSALPDSVNRYVRADVVLRRRNGQNVRVRRGVALDKSEGGQNENGPPPRGSRSMT